MPLKSVELFAASADNPFAPIAFVYRRAVHERIGLFDERFSVVGDWDFNLRFLAAIRDRSARTAPGQLPLASPLRWFHLCQHRDRRAGCASRENEPAAQPLPAAATSKQGQLGLGLPAQPAQTLRGNSALLWDVRHRSDQAIHEIWKVQSRLRHWEWLLTRNPKLRRPRPRRAPKPRKRRRAQTIPFPLPPRAADAVPDCREELAALTSEPLRQAGAAACCPWMSLTRPCCGWCVGPSMFPVDGGADAPATRRAGAARAVTARSAPNAPPAAGSATRAGHEEVTLEEIYDVFCELAEIDPATHRADVDPAGDRGRGRLLYANPPVLAACLAAARAGIRVVYASDMYLPRAFILETAAAGTAIPWTTRRRCFFPRNVARASTLATSTIRCSRNSAALPARSCTWATISIPTSSRRRPRVCARSIGRARPAPDNLPLFEQLPPAATATALSPTGICFPACVWRWSAVTVRWGLLRAAPCHAARAESTEARRLPSATAPTTQRIERNAVRAGHGTLRLPRTSGTASAMRLAGRCTSVFLHWILNQARAEGHRAAVFPRPRRLSPARGVRHPHRA